MNQPNHKFTEDMYRRVGLTTHTGSVGQSRRRPANLNETSVYRVTDDHRDISMQRRLAGIHESEKLNFPNPSAPVGLRPLDDDGILDIRTTLDIAGISREPGRLFESRDQQEVRQNLLEGRLRNLHEKRKRVQAQLEEVSEEINRLEASASPGKTGVKAEKVRGGYVLIRQRQDGNWVGLGANRPKYIEPDKDTMLKAMERDANEKFRSRDAALEAFDTYYKHVKEFMSK